MGSVLFFVIASVVALAGGIQSSENQYNTYNPQTYDVCKTEYTMQHYLQSQCFEIQRPVYKDQTENFKLRAVLLTANLKSAAQKTTVILIPGGPGESSGPLRYALNAKDVLNSMVMHLNLNVVLYDPRGTGSSKFQKPVSDYGIEAFASPLMNDDLHALINAVSPKQPVILLAHSAGGATAVQVAIDHQKRVSKLVLVSTSTSPRQMGLINLERVVLHSPWWSEFLKAHPQLSKDMDSQYQKIEEVIRGQQKARILDQFVHPEFPKITITMWRDELLVLAERDPTGQFVQTRIQTVYNDIAEMEKHSGQMLVPDALRQKRLTYADMAIIPFKGEEWIKAAVMCGQGLTESEMNEEIYLDGMTMSRFCNGFHAESVSKLVKTDLSQVKMPVLFLAGLQDVQVPAQLARQITAQLPNAKLVLEPNASHMIFYEAPFVFYKALEEFLR